MYDVAQAYTLAMYWFHDKGINSKIYIYSKIKNASHDS